MIDTVRFFRPHQLYNQPLPPGWSTSSFSHSSHTRPDPRHGVRYHHEASGLTASGDGGEIKTLTVSLPHLLHGSNGYLIKSQAEIHAATQRMDVLLSEVGRALNPGYRFSRVDLVWQFALDPERVIQAHRYTRHTRIRRNAGRWENESLFWEGSLISVKIYDKCREQFKRPGNVTRIEFQLHGKVLNQLLGDGFGKVTQLDFNQAYQAYRELTLGFCPADVPQGGSIAELLAIGEAAGWSHNGQSQFDIYTTGMNAEYKRTLQRQVAALRPKYFKLDWAALMPVDGPPAPVDLIPTIVPGRYARN